MPVPKIVAHTPRGTFTRRSPHPYRFVVVVGGQAESYTRRFYAANRATAEQNIRRYQAVLDSGVVPAKEARFFTVDDYQTFIDETRQHVRQYSPEAEEAAVKREAAKAWGIAGWSRTQRNAEKAAHQARQWAAKVEIYEILEDGSTIRLTPTQES